MKIKLAILATCLNLSVTVMLSYAHHSDVAYLTTSIELKDVKIVKVVWANPHSIVSFDAKDDTGKVTQWITEMGSPSAMIAVGWNRNSLSAGDLVTVSVYPAKNGTPHGRLARVRYPDGKVLNYREVR